MGVSSYNPLHEGATEHARPVLDFLNPYSYSEDNPFRFTEPSESLLSFLENYEEHYYTYIDEETGNFDLRFGNPPYRTFSRKELLEISFAKFLSETGPYWKLKMGEFMPALEVAKHYNELVDSLEEAEVLGRPRMTNRALLVELHNLLEEVETSYLSKHISVEDPAPFVPHFGLILQYLTTTIPINDSDVAKRKRCALLEETGREELSRATVSDLNAFLEALVLKAFKKEVRAGWTGTIEHLTDLKKTSEDLIEEFHRVAADEENSLSPFMQLALTGKTCKYIEIPKHLAPLHKSGGTGKIAFMSVGGFPKITGELNPAERATYCKQFETVLKELSARIFTLYQSVHLVLEEAKKQIAVVEKKKRRIAKKSGSQFPENELKNLNESYLAKKANEKLFEPCLENLQSLALAVSYLNLKSKD